MRHRQTVHPCIPVTKQYNLVPVNGQGCSAAGKVTVGPASPAKSFYFISDVVPC